MQGPHTRTTRAQKTWATGPSYPPPGRADGTGRASDTRQPSQRCEATPEDVLLPPPQLATPARRSALSGAGAGSPRPHQPRQENNGQRDPASYPKHGKPGGGEHLTPDTPPPRCEVLPPLRATCRYPRGARHPAGYTRQRASASNPHPHPRTQPGGNGPRLPAQGTGSKGRTSA